MSRSFSVTALIAGLFLIAPQASAATYIYDNVASDTTWTKTNSPYIVANGVAVDPGVTLTIEAGVVVKPEGGITVMGTLDVNGTSDEKVFFTSSNDSINVANDAHGECPDCWPGDWKSVTFESGSVGSIDNAVFRYGGRMDMSSGCFEFCPVGLIYDSGGAVSASNSLFTYSDNFGVLIPETSGGTLTVSSSEFAFSTFGISADDGPVTVSNSSFHDLGDAYWGFGLQKRLSAVVTAENNWWGAGSGPHHVTLNPAGTGVTVVGNVTLSPWLTTEPIAPASVNPAQFLADGVSTLPSGATATGVVVLNADLGSPAAEPVALQVEVKPVGQVFNGLGMLTSAFLSASGTASIAVDGLPIGGYRWRARATTHGGSVSPWLDFGTAGTADFVIDAPPAPSLSGLRQLDNDGNDIVPSTETRQSGLSLRAAVSSPSGAPIKLQVQVRPMAEPFDDDTVTAESPLVSYEGEVNVPFRAYLDVPYHWQARVADETGNYSPWIEFGTNPAAADFVEFVRTFKVAVVMAETSDISHLSASTSSQPCKLLPAKNYADGHGRDYYEDLGYCVNDYYRENSFGKISFEFHYYDNGGGWYGLPNNEASYGIDVRNPTLYGVLKGMVDGASSVAAVSNSDITLLIHSGYSQQRMGENKISTTALRKSTPQYVVVSEHDLTGQWSHELSHAVGVETTPLATMTPDLYLMGKNTKKWCLMASGDTNGTHGSDPAPMCSYVREFLGWMKTDSQSIIAANDFGEHVAASAATGDYGQAVTRINLSDDTSVSTQDYYLVEARPRHLGNWNSSMPTGLASALVLFRVKENGFIEYGYDAAGVGYNLQRSVNLAADRRYGLDPLNDGVLDPGKQDQYIDYDRGLVIKALVDESSGGIHGTRFSVSPYDYTAETTAMAGGVLISALPLWARLAVQPNLGSQGVNLEKMPLGQGQFDCLSANPPAFLDTYRDIAYVLLLVAFLAAALGWSRYKSRKMKKRTAIAVMTVAAGLAMTALGLYVKAHVDRGGYGTVCRNAGAAHGAPSEEGILPDNDLHASCSDGRHIGVNYETGAYEVNIEGAVSNGDNAGTPEWIFFPATPENAGCRLYVSSHNSEAFLAAHPYVAAQVPDPSERYSIYARIIDPVTGILTSATLDDQIIEPGVEVVHEIATNETGIPVVEPGVVDDITPTTSAFVTGPAGQNGWYPGTVTVALSADDHFGTGTASTEYSTDGGLSWAVYVEPFTVSGDGVHEILYGSRDRAGNSETTKTLEIKISPDQDGDGVLDAADDCPATAGAPERNGCPFADRTNVDMRIIDSAKTGACGFRPNGQSITECTRSLPGVTVRVFDRDDADFRAAFGGRRPAKHLMDDVYESGIGLVAAYTTGADGSCLAGEDHPGRFLVVMKYAEGSRSAYTGKFKEFRKAVRLAYDAEDDDDDVFTSVNPNYLTLTKNLHVIKHIKNGGGVKLDGGKLTVVTGSRLDVLQPDYVVWSGDEELYPFVLTADDNDWTVNACLEVPSGYEIAGVLDGDGNITSATNCFSTVLRNESMVFLFRAVDVGSPEPDFGLTLKASHPGKAPTRVKTRLEGMRSRMEAGMEKGVHGRVKALAPKWSGRAGAVEARSGR